MRKSPWTKKTVEERFWPKVDKRGDDECWPWVSSTVSRGYGMMFVASGQRPGSAHRISYELHFGKIPEGLLVRHKCDNRICVNPRHLELGTKKDNAMDASVRGRLNPKSLLNLHPMAGCKLRTQDVVEIRRLRKTTKITIKALANKFNVSHGTIERIIYGGTYKHV